MGAPIISGPCWIFRAWPQPSHNTASAACRGWPKFQLGRSVQSSFTLVVLSDCARATDMPLQTENRIRKRGGTFGQLERFNRNYIHALLV